MLKLLNKADSKCYARTTVDKRMGTMSLYSSTNIAESPLLAVRAFSVSFLVKIVIFINILINLIYKIPCIFNSIAYLSVKIFIYFSVRTQSENFLFVTNY